MFVATTSIDLYEYVDIAVQLRNVISFGPILLPIVRTIVSMFKGPAE